MQETTLALLSLGFGLGLLHALDADHIMAVSTLASGQSSAANPRSRRKTLLFCLQWAFGHGGILLFLGSLVLLAGVAIPESVSFFAEKAVGVILVALGLWIFWQFYQKKLQLQVHSHNGITHMHLASASSKDQDDYDKSRHDHRPVLVGITHGVAGSAPVLAIVPMSQAGQGWFGLVYVGMFSVGVVLTMIIFGLLFAQLQNTVQKYSSRLFDYSRLFLATLSISFGGYWLFSV